MKKLIFMLVLICFCFGCSEQMAVTLLSSPNEFEDSTTEYAIRLGAQVEQTEVGLASYWWPEGDADIDQTYGAYILQSLTDPNGLGLLGRPYIGGQATLDIDNDGGMYAFIAGTVYEMGGVEILTEFQLRSFSEYLKEANDSGTDRYKVAIGTRFRF